MILDDIKEALAEVNGPVFYGTAAALPKGNPWDYVVFSRASADMNANLDSISEVFEVAVVHEGYIPEGVVAATAKAMRDIPGMRIAQGSSVKYVYDVKPGTATTVEMAVMTFNKASKATRGVRR